MNSGKPMRAKRTLDRVVRLAIGRARRLATRLDGLGCKERACGIRVGCNIVIYALDDERRTVAGADTSKPNK